MLTAVRIGLVILPSDRWTEARHQWEWADRVGFETAWTYDHVRWGGMPDGPWHAAVPVLAAAAAVTERVRLGTLVATPNFRHPVTLARDALALDDVSGGRLDLGLGPGSVGPDATALGQEPWTTAERMARFGEFLQVLQPIVDGEPTTRTTLTTDHYRSDEAPSTPGALQRPLPLTIAAGGPKGMRLAARHGRNWVTVGPTGPGPRTPEAHLEAVQRQLPQLEEACRAERREPADIGKVVLFTPTEPDITSVEQFDDLAGPYAELGIDQFVIHHPAQTGPYNGDVAVFEQIAARTVT
ncbi:MAG TPA: LLM class flavin-dependent oxidoreductase [Acidimicrobiales bacterium]|jgi:alkanesulfonate monooxygenase SsuD/methylene tetrahydromethanopterin reductase-like flavin-dependent oxidoreductase (luciferase family)|nr:LLM class flavin-dependent oxidoreductase [Acidimicrobiales bacterium]